MSRKLSLPGQVWMWAAEANSQEVYGLGPQCARTPAI